MEEYRELGDRLRARLRHLSRRLEDLDRDIGHLVPARGLPHGRLEDVGPALEEILSLSRAELVRIQDALLRLAHGTFGRCVSCDGPVSIERLRLLPHVETCAGCADRDEHDTAWWLRHEHDALRAELLALQRWVRSLADAQAPAADGSEGDAARDPQRQEAAQRVFLVLLSDFRREVLDHFGREESAGYLGDALAIAPRLARRADALLREHAALDKELDRLLQHAGFVHPRTNDWQRLSHELDAFARELGRHERAENDLVAEAFLDDVGAVD